MVTAAWATPSPWSIVGRVCIAFHFGRPHSVLFLAELVFITLHSVVVPEHSVPRTFEIAKTKRIDGSNVTLVGKLYI